MTNQSDSDLERKYKIIGWAAMVCFILGIISGAAMLFMYKGHKSAQDLATILVGSSGLIFTLGSALLFGYTIFQTKHEIGIQLKEMRKSNKIFDKQYELALSQQYKNIFFSLLENHANLVSTFNFDEKQGYEGLNEFSTEAKLTVEDYYDCIEDKAFLKPSDTQCFPNYDFKESMDSLVSIIDDLHTIVQYIEEFLKDDLYYKILSNFLPVSEKYSIGLYCNFNMTEKAIYFAEHRFDFLSYYKPYKRIFDTKNYFPVIDISWNMEPISYFSIKNEIHIFNVETKILQNEFDVPLILEYITFNVYNIDKVNVAAHYDRTSIDGTMGPNNKLMIDNLNHLVAKYVLSSNDHGYREVRFQFIFNFSYSNEHYIVSEQFDFDRLRTGEHWTFRTKVDNTVNDNGNNSVLYS